MYSFEEVMLAKSQGGSFVTYQWIIPRPIFYPVRRLSKVYFIPKGMNKSKYASKFNLISLIIGWWGLPYGPFAVYNSVTLNNNGGIDVTEDVYLNLDKTGYSRGRFELIKSVTKFVALQKSEQRELSKVFKALLESNVLKHEPVVGLYIDCEQGIEPYTIIGFNENIQNKTDLIHKAIRKRFRSHYTYELIELREDSHLAKELSKQGFKL